MASTKMVSGAVALVLAGALHTGGFPDLTAKAGTENARGHRGPPQLAIRIPRGIYAVVVMDPPHAPDLAALLNNTAVSGLAIRMFWSSLQPASDRYDFKSLDAAFDSAT